MLLLKKTCKQQKLRGLRYYVYNLLCIDPILWSESAQTEFDDTAALAVLYVFLHLIQIANEEKGNVGIAWRSTWIVVGFEPGIAVNHDVRVKG
jgi:hypothetical protein